MRDNVSRIQEGSVWTDVDVSIVACLVFRSHRIWKWVTNSRGMTERKVTIWWDYLMQTGCGRYCEKIKELCTKGLLCLQNPSRWNSDILCVRKSVLMVYLDQTFTVGWLRTGVCISWCTGHLRDFIGTVGVLEGYWAALHHHTDSLYQVGSSQVADNASSSSS